MSSAEPAWEEATEAKKKASEEVKAYRSVCGQNAKASAPLSVGEDVKKMQT